MGFMGGTGPGGVEEEEDDQEEEEDGKRRGYVEEMVEEGTGRESDEYA
jgi:hypothetical protein